ncbi:MAG TPA: vanadium-dependent haloperoxidase [Gaiella sp.]|nr:vanadium-dependent haloperoxidase [Gaiella sp.]
MIRSFRRPLLACAVLAAALAAPGVARADVIRDWNLIAQQQTIPLRPTAHGESRGMAMVEGAVYDAVNAIDGGHQPYLLDPRAIGAQPWFSQDAAAATAAHDVLVAIAPAQQATIDGLYASTMAGITDAFKAQGAQVGAAAAQAMLAFRQNDGFLAPFDFGLVIAPGAGNWRPLTPAATDPDAWVGNAKPFLIESPEQFRSEGPNALESGQYTKDFNEVKELGALDSTKRTADETAAAVFWQFPPIALWNGVARSLAGSLDTADQARLYAMINLAAADGAISCWNDKWYWHFWRPLAAIREADTDGNPATVADPTWEPLFAPATQTTPPLVTPPFPDHPSGHGCVSGATVNAFQDFFGTDKASFDVVGGRSLNGLPIPARHFDRFSNALKEVIDARVWGGIHFRTADVQGTVIGKKVAHWMRKHYFEPVR